MAPVHTELIKKVDQLLDEIKIKADKRGCFIEVLLKLNLRKNNTLNEAYYGWIYQVNLDLSQSCQPVLLYLFEWGRVELLGAISVHGSRRGLWSLSIALFVELEHSERNTEGSFGAGTLLPRDQSGCVWVLHQNCVRHVKTAHLAWLWAHVDIGDQFRVQVDIPNCSLTLLFDQMYRKWR